MNKTFNKTKFKNLVNFGVGFTKVLFILTLVGAGLSLLGTIVLLVIPSSTFNGVSSESFGIEIGDVIEYTLEYSLETGKSVKLLALSGTISGFVLISYLSFLLFTIRKILVDTKNDNPFSDSNVKSLFAIALTIIIGAILIPLVKLGLGYVLMNQLNEPNINITYGVDTNMIFVGLLIFILANIFQYGAYLQNEYDQTV